MPRDNYTDITIILDRSGSMNWIKEGTIRGINSFIQEQKSVPGDGCWTLVQFDDPASAKGADEAFPHVVYAQKGQEEVPELTEKNFVPRNATALIDAVCMTIDATGKRLEAMDEKDRPSGVMMVIMTDGLENASKKFSRQDLNERIAHQQSKYKWVFLFLGANQDAIEVGTSYGNTRGNNKTYEYSNEGALEVMKCASSGTRRWKAEGNRAAEDLLTSAAPDLTVAVSVTKKE
jgi:hypothetical protein